FPVRETFAALAGAPVTVTVHWRAYTAATAEMWWGLGRRLRDFVYVNVDNGIGMAAISGKRIVSGHQNMAGMLGHVPVPGGTRRCVCGNRGCLQTLVSVPALIHAVAAATREGVSSVLTRAPAPEHVSFDALVQA